MNGQIPITDFNDPNFEVLNLDPITLAEYTFENDLQRTPIYVELQSPFALQDDKHYLFCANSSSTEVDLGFDNSIDYEQNLRGTDGSGSITHGDGFVTSTIVVDGQFFGNSFNGNVDIVSSLMLHTVDAIELSVEEEEVKLDGAFPNPAINTITVPLKGLKGAGTLNITDMTGKMVYSEQVSLGASQLILDVTNIPSGRYVFSLDLENGTLSTFNVVINK